MKPVTVLMYHAIVAGDAVGADAHYSVTPDHFAAQLRQIIASGAQMRSVRELITQPADAATAQPVCLTFDDGHVSNQAAAELIASHGGQAEFFINPSMVAKPGFLDWPALREMASAGMSIQSHGMHHRYLDQLSPDEVRAELADSKAAIEDAIGQPVTVYAPAGGRMPADFLRTAHGLGYRAVCSSRVGLWHRPHRPAADQAIELPRLAMLRSTDAQRFLAWIEQHPLELFRQIARYRVLRLSKQLLGNQGHERLRALLLGATSTPSPGDSAQPNPAGQRSEADDVAHASAPTSRPSLSASSDEQHP